MRQLRLPITIAIVAVLGMTGAALADVSLSKSNSPAAVLGSELSKLLDQERPYGRRNHAA